MLIFVASVLLFLRKSGLLRRVGYYGMVLWVLGVDAQLGSACRGMGRAVTFVKVCESEGATADSLTLVSNKVSKSREMTAT